MKKTFMYITILLLFSLTAKGNNVQVSNVVLADQNAGTSEVSIQFDISWENSWRVSSAAPNNWDAVWLFAKYKSVDGNWHHATLSQNNNSTGSQLANANLSVRGDNVGAYFYRSGDGTGSFSSAGVKLRWNYGVDNISCNLGKEIIEVKVFAIEMVFVPAGAFYVGSGGTELGHFYTSGSNNPYQITSEAAINVGNNSGDLTYVSAGDGIGPIPASFPKGYNAFYCMKYEITQGQYAEFLNTLSTVQTATRYVNHFNSYRYYIALVNGVYGCDANTNGTLNEANDGQNIACNYLRWSDGVAYLDWAGLRPMTELEFEKACRGIVAPVADEYAWGNTNVVRATSVINGNSESETCIPSNANCIYDGGFSGPVRVGNFARVGSTRTSSGATYYGIMEMSGNVWERAITVGNVEGRNFTGVLGDGTLTVDGFANVANWGAVDAAGSGFRGSNWYLYTTTSNTWRISDRCSAAASWNGTQNGYGCRGVGGF